MHTAYTHIMHSMTTNQLTVYTKDAYIDYLRPIYWFFFYFYFFVGGKLFSLFLLFNLILPFVSLSERERGSEKETERSRKLEKKLQFVYDFNNQRIRNN